MSDTPQLLNLIESISGDLNLNYILVAYKNKCDLISEKTGDCIRQFQFNQLSTIHSLVELYDNDRLEILVTHSCKFDLKNTLHGTYKALNSD